MTSKEKLKTHLSLYHPKLKIDDLKISNVPGYWHIKGGCPGSDNCVHGFRSTLGACDGSGLLTIKFSEHGKRDKKGQFISPYKVWNDLKDI